MIELDLRALGLREINGRLNGVTEPGNARHFAITNPMGQHAIACGLQAPLDVEIRGHVGFYCGGMNKRRRSRCTATPGSAWPRT